MSFPKFYEFDASLPGDVRLVFDDHPMHVRNLREHLEGFIALPDLTFDVWGVWKRPNVLLYANGYMSRMRDGLVWRMPKQTRPALAEWLSKVEWPTTEETMSKGFLLPGRWLKEEEAARFWLFWQGCKPHLTRDEVKTELEKRGVRMSRFSEHIPRQEPKP